MNSAQATQTLYDLVFRYSIPLGEALSGKLSDDLKDSLPEGVWEALIEAVEAEQKFLELLNSLHGEHVGS